jgi:hypothetical protein
MATITHEQYIMNRKNSSMKIVGTKQWTKNKYGGKFLRNKTITRNSMKFSKKRFGYDKDYSEMAFNRGWQLDDMTSTWTHPNYKNKTFDSLIINTKNGRKLLPYCSGDDSEGLAYNYKVSGSGLYRSVYPNRWASEEFDTRRGKRRGLFEKKKELKKLSLKVINNEISVEDFENEFNYD